MYGVNHKKFNIDDENIFSAASCTTNAIAPILHIINKEKKISKGHIEKQYMLILMIKIY